MFSIRSGRWEPPGAHGSELLSPEAPRQGRGSPCGAKVPPTADASVRNSECGPRGVALPLIAVVTFFEPGTAGIFGMP